VQFGREEGEELPDVVGIQFTGMSLARGTRRSA